MAILKAGPAVKCRKCAKIFRTDLPDNLPLAKHAGTCDGKLQLGVLTVYKYCPAGNETHDREIITRGDPRKIAAQTHCHCDTPFMEREIFSPSAP